MKKKAAEAKFRTIRSLDGNRLTEVANAITTLSLSRFHVKISSQVGVSPEISFLPRLYVVHIGLSFNQMEIRHSNHLVDDSVLRVVWHSIGVTWKQLGRELQIPESMLDDIFHRYRTQGVEEMAYQMLRIWRQSASTHATVSFLTAQLQEIGRKDISDHILNMFTNPRDVGTNQKEAYSASHTGQQMTGSSSSKSQTSGGSRPDTFSHPRTEDRLVDETILIVVAERISRQWMELGRILGIPDSKLDDITLDYVSYGVQEMVYQILNIWREAASTKATVAFLARKLQEIGRMDVSQHILKLLPNPSDGASTSHYGDTNPSYGSTKPSYGDTNPRYDDTNPCYGGTKPRYGNTNQSYGGTNPRYDVTNRIGGILAEWLEEFKNKLHDRYQKFAMKGLPWKHNIVLSNSNSYVDEEIKSQDINKALKRVLSANEQPLRVLVEGTPDYEKTNLLDKLCFDYVNYEDYIRIFDVVLQYSLRHFNGYLEDMFFEAAGLTDIHDKENLLKIVNNKYTRVLLLLHGFDEVPKQHEKAILSLLQGEQFPNLAVVITSRPGQLTLIRRRIKILGEHNGLRERFVKNPFDRIP